MHDVRGQEHTLSLEADGFKYVDVECRLGTRLEPAALIQDMEEATEIPREHLGAEKAICYDIRVKFISSILIILCSRKVL
jgi:hypothetical protein